MNLENVETYNVHYDPRPKKKVAKDKTKKEKKKDKAAGAQEYSRLWRPLCVMRLILHFLLLRLQSCKNRLG